jgi:hypothetical protein
MQTLEQKFVHDGFWFTQIARHGPVAVFEKKRAGSKIVGFETVIIQKLAAITWPDGAITPEAESLPKSDQWGECGWTLCDRTSALAKMEQALANLKKQQPNKGK